MPCFRLVAPLLAVLAMAVVASAEPVVVDAARQSEKYGIQPGAESLFADMLGGDQTLPGGCKLDDGQIERISVLATYTCGGGEQVVLQLVHPETAPPGGIRTERFALSVKSGAAPAGLVEAVAERIRARESAFAGTKLGTRRMPLLHWAVPIAAGAVVAMLVFLALRRIVGSRRRPD